MSVVIYGASDDLIEVEGDVQGCDEYSEDDAHFVLTGVGATVRVRCWFTKRGLWAIAAAPVEEDAPTLPVMLTAKGYSMRAEIEGVVLVVHEAGS